MIPDGYPMGIPYIPGGWTITGRPKKTIFVQNKQQTNALFSQAQIIGWSRARKLEKNSERSYFRSRYITAILDFWRHFQTSGHLTWQNNEATGSTPPTIWCLWTDSVCLSTAKYSLPAWGIITTLHWHQACIITVRHKYVVGLANFILQGDFPSRDLHRFGSHSLLERQSQMVAGPTMDSLVARSTSRNYT